MNNQSILITGGAGFIGVNSAAYFAEQGWNVSVLDNLSRPGSAENLNWLNENHTINFNQSDIRDPEAVEQCIKSTNPDVVLHLAGQVAVTTSVLDPRADFEINALGTLNTLEAIRKHAAETFFINASTNKVYGRMEHLKIVDQGGRYGYESLPGGVSESQPLEFHSPYGCSKGVADQYTIDYARIYGLNTVTLRQSCIYGPHQMGVEDQGWVAWFIIAALSDKPITIFGDGKQVRDVLHVHDLIECYQMAIEHRIQINGQAFNVGGGVDNTLSLLELLALIEHYTGKLPRITREDWRPGDQPLFICDLHKVQRTLGWQPETETRKGIQSLIDWVQKNGVSIRN